MALRYGDATAQPPEQVKLWTNKKEREQFNNQADLFALIKTVDRLEKAYVRDAIR